MTVIETYFGPDEPGETDNKFDANSFLGFLRRSNPIWQTNPNGPVRRQWVYRGHWDHRWALVPSAARRLEPKLETQGPNKLNPIIEVVRERLNTHSKWEVVNAKARDQFVLIAAYCVAMRDFISLGNDMGLIDFPAPKEDLLGNNSTLRERFDTFAGRRLCGPGPGDVPSPFANGCDFQPTFVSLPGQAQLGEHVTALAQHHGVPTFLLDWTENPWVAAYFATNSRREQRDQHDVCVWALNNRITEEQIQSAAETEGLGSIRSYKPPKSGNAYLASQSGLMTYVEAGQWDQRPDLFLSGEELYPTVESIISAYQHDKVSTSGRLANLPDNRNLHKEYLEKAFPENLCLLRKVVLCKEHLPKLRHLLRLEGITLAHMMPTLDNIAKTSFELLLGTLVQK